MRHDAEYLLDIRNASKTILDWVAEIDEDAFTKSKLYQSAILFQLMIIGEAAAWVSDDIRTTYQTIPWKSIRGFRNIIVHSYFRLSLPIVWSAALNDSQLLFEEIEKILAIEFPITLSHSDD